MPEKPRATIEELFARLAVRELRDELLAALSEFETAQELLDHLRRYTRPEESA